MDDYIKRDEYHKIVVGVLPGTLLVMLNELCIDDIV